MHGAHETWADKPRGKVWVDEPVVQQRQRTEARPQDSGAVAMVAKATECD